MQQTLNLKHVTLPSAWDAAKLTQLSLTDGTTYMEMVRDIDAALELASSQLLTNFSSHLLGITEEVAVEYPSGSTTGYQRITERGRAESKRAGTVGHMNPLVGFDAELNWTSLWMRNARRAQIDTQLDNLVERTLDLFEKEVWTRFFSNAELTGEYYGLGNSGISMPFLAGAGDTFAFTPPPKPERGGTFAASHSHYLRLDGITQANLETAVEHLWEHGYDGPYDLIIPKTDIADWTNATNVTGYLDKPAREIMYGDEVSLANISDRYIGAVKTKFGVCRIYANGRIPTGYWGLTVTAGANSLSNPLRVRKETGRPFGPILVVDMLTLYPLQGAVSEFFFGVGVGPRRDSAVLVENDTSGVYAAPTIS